METLKRIPIAEPTFDETELKYVTDAVTSGWVSSRGEYIKKFENAFATYCGSKYAVSCNNGTSALHLALLAIGIKEGDEVIVPVSTYIATANAVKYMGGKPVFVDSSESDWNIDVSKIEEKITPKTKAIIPVHLYGVSCDMESIMKIAEKHNLFVIEDCAESFGSYSTFTNKTPVHTGTSGHIGSFSFFGNKTITTGEGGMCITNSEELKDKLELFKNQGTTGGYWHTVVGFNYRMTNLQAAIGLAQIEKSDKIIRNKKANTALYDSLLSNLEGISLPPRKKHSHLWMYVIQSDQKDKIMKEFEKNNIDTRPFFPTITSMPPYYSEEKFPVAEKLYKNGLTLPSSANLTEEDIIRICEAIKQALKNER